MAMKNICDNVTVHSFSWSGSPYINYIKMSIEYDKSSGGMTYTFKVTLDNRTYSTSYYNPEIYVELRFSNGQMITNDSTKLFKANNEQYNTNWIISREYVSTYTGDTAPKLEVRVYHTRTSDYYFDTGWNAYPTNGTLDFLTPPSVTNLTLTPDGYNSITFNWTANKKASKIRYKLYNGSSWSNWNELNVSPENSSGSYRLTNLEFYHEYKLILQAYNAAGWSSDSSTVTDKTWGAFMYHKDGNTWRKCLVWYKDGNTWKKTIPYFKEGSTWKKSIIK